MEGEFSEVYGLLLTLGRAGRTDDLGTVASQVLVHLLQDRRVG